MNLQESAQIQVLLEGVPLPATKKELVAYARAHDARVAEALQSIADRKYRSLDDVGEQLASVQPPWPHPDAEVPRAESGRPPGGDAYVDPQAESGAVRDDDPPKKTLQKQSETQKKQAKRQETRGSGKAKSAS